MLTKYYRKYKRYLSFVGHMKTKMIFAGNLNEKGIKNIVRKKMNSFGW
jgi:hypothetical protein